MDFLCREGGISLTELYYNTQMSLSVLCLLLHIIDIIIIIVTQIYIKDKSL